MPSRSLEAEPSKSTVNGAVPEVAEALSCAVGAMFGSLDTSIATLWVPTPPWLSVTARVTV